MDEYIDRRGLIAALNTFAPEQYTVLLNQLITEYPTADVVEVVRCKDCVNYKQNPYDKEENLLCQCWCDWLPTEPNDFCSYGERKEE